MKSSCCIELERDFTDVFCDTSNRGDTILQPGRAKRAGLKINANSA